MPFMTGSTTVSAIAAAKRRVDRAAPFASIASPACEASGWLVATQLAASSGMRVDG